jgi:hypothetical protein
LTYKQPYREKRQKFPQEMAGSILYLKTFFQLLRTKSNYQWVKSHVNFNKVKITAPLCTVHLQYGTFVCTVCDETLQGMLRSNRFLDPIR